MRCEILIGLGCLMVSSIAARADIIDDSRDWKSASYETVRGYAAEFNRELDKAMKEGDYERAGQLADAYGDIFNFLVPNISVDELPQIDVNAIDQFRNMIAIGKSYMFTKDFSGEYVPIIPVTREYIEEHIANQVLPFQELEYIDLEEEEFVPIEIVEYEEPQFLEIDARRGLSGESTDESQLVRVVDYPEVSLPAPPDKVFEVVEIPAQFPGGQGALMKWIGENLQYPADALDKNMEGKVIVRMIVEKDGKISNPLILKESIKSFNEETLRLVNSMPAWIPGENNGEPVRSYFTIPINFKLSK